MTNLIQYKCVTCENNIPPLKEEEIEEYLGEIPEWEVVEVDGAHRLKQTFKFNDFVEALKFTNEVGEIAEEEGHHPVIVLTWGRVTIEWWTHNIHGLHKNDFIMAARTSVIFNK